MAPSSISFSSHPDSWFKHYYLSALSCLLSLEKCFLVAQTGESMTGNSWDHNCRAHPSDNISTPKVFSSSEWRTPWLSTTTPCTSSKVHRTLDISGSVRPSVSMAYHHHHHWLKPGILFWKLILNFLKTKWTWSRTCQEEMATCRVLRESFYA